VPDPSGRLAAVSLSSENSASKVFTPSRVPARRSRPVRVTAVRVSDGERMPRPSGAR